MADSTASTLGEAKTSPQTAAVPGPVPTSPANRDYQPGFAGALMAKDLGLALQAIEQTSTDAKMGRLAQQLYAAFAAGDGATRDFSGIITDSREDRV